jgi:hypothetical protein
MPTPPALPITVRGERVIEDRRRVTKRAEL